ncbi:MAG: short-chain fatty acid transporter [bacterium]
MIERIGELFNRLAARFMPHPFVFAILLTIFAFALGWLWAGASPAALVGHWADGVFTPALLTFMVQMCLILVTGHALASTRPVGAALARIASLPRGPRSAVAITSLVTMATALVNWGLALIVGALLAREVARSARVRGIAIHFPLVVAAGFTGLIIWHGGLSGSAPLTVATPGHFLETQIGLVPVTATLLSPLNLVLRAALLAAVPLFLALMVPRDFAARAASGGGGGGERVRWTTGDVALERIARAAEDGLPPAITPSAASRGERTREASAPPLAERLDRSRALALAIVALCAAFVAARFAERGIAALELNTIIVAFLALGLALHGTPIRYARAIDDAAAGASGILLQFPLYFGIMGIVKGAGLTAPLAGLFVRASDALSGAGVPVDASYGVMTFLSATVINVLVPSGGGQWAVQGPIAVEAAERLGVPASRAVLAIAYGDECSNMLQPFWALPLLAITGLSARDIFGYTALLMFLVAPIFIALLAVM